MSTTTLSTQKLVPGLPSTISVISLGAQSCGVLLDALNTGTGTKVFGVSLRLSKKGLMEAVALGTPETVFLISLVHDNPAQKRRKQASKAKPPSDPVGLSHILNNEHCLLAGFQMPRLALLLQRQANKNLLRVRSGQVEVVDPVKLGEPIERRGTKNHAYHSFQTHWKLKLLM